MTFDVCLVSYNSESWLRPCVAALAAASREGVGVCLYVADNASEDASLGVLKELQTEYAPAFAAFTVLPMGENLGFGTASNAAARAGSGDLVFFLNVDTEVDPAVFVELAAAVAAAGEKTAAWECRQFPYEHPKFYNPATLTASWASGACLVLRREAFAATGGFDESIFLYAEDVDLSWRLRAAGHKIQYVPAAVVHHYAYGTPGQEKPAQVAGSLVGNLVLRLKYGTEADIAWWNAHYETHREGLLANPQVAPLLKAGLKRAQKHRRAYREFYKKRIEENPVFAPKFLGLDYEFARAGAFYENRLPASKPRFSVLVRTHGRPDALALTLESLTFQTYKSFEVVLVEDGEEPLAAAVAERFAGRLQLRYHPLKRQAGRCVAGNEAIRLAESDWLCFLDDDDYFYPEHLEVMACLVEDNPDCRLHVAGAVEAACTLLNSRGTRWKVEEKANIAYPKITFATLCYGNPFPIQAAVFHKSLPAEAGGLAEEMDAFEDWDMWLRFGMHTQIASVEKATSFYKIPAGEVAFARREKNMAHYRRLLYQRAAGYTATVSAQDILALVYTPEKAQKYEDAGQNAIDYLAYKEGLAQTAAAIARSRTWRLTAPLRALPRLLAMLTGLISRGSGGLAAATARMADRVGPRPPDIAKKDPAQLNDFIFKSRRSLSWRVGTALRKEDRDAAGAD